MLDDDRAAINESQVRELCATLVGQAVVVKHREIFTDGTTTDPMWKAGTIEISNAKPTRAAEVGGISRPEPIVDGHHRLHHEYEVNYELRVSTETDQPGTVPSQTLGSWFEFPHPSARYYEIIPAAEYLRRTAITQHATIESLQTQVGSLREALSRLETKVRAMASGPRAAKPSAQGSAKKKTSRRTKSK